MFRNNLLLLLLGSLLISVWIIPTALPQEQTENQDVAEVQESETVNPFFERLVPPDRTLFRRYDQAGRLIEAGRLPEAAQLLGAILENSADYFVQPHPPNSNPPTQTSDQLFSDLVLDRLQGLPAKALESYSLQFEAQAKRLLENAVQNGSIEGIQQVARFYFPTTSGATAAFLLGMDQFEQGAYESALLTLQRLNQSRHNLTPFDPILSLTLASLQLRFHQTDKARQTVEHLLKNHPNPTILLSGNETWTPKSTDEIITRLEALRNESKAVPMASWLERTGWLLGMGTPRQNSETTAQKPLLELIWSVPTLNKSLFNWEANNLLSLVRKGTDAYIPAAQPLLVGNHLLVRGLGEITAIDLRTGKQLWTAAESEYQISKSIQLPYPMNFNAIRLGGSNHLGPLRVFLWHDRITHQMSSDGSRIWTVDGLDMRSLAYAALGRGARNLQIGKKSVEDPRWGAGNTLVARDVKTGQTLWQIGKFPYVQKRFDQYAEEFETEQNERKKEKDNKTPTAEAAKRKTEEEQKNEKKNANENNKPVANRNNGFTEEELFFSETWFLGAPLPLRGRIHVIGENAGILRLIVLDAETGRLIRQQPLGAPENPFEMDPFRKYYGLIPSASDGMILCPTGIGLVVALDATTMVPVWCFSYLATEKEDSNVRNQLRQIRNRQFGGAVHGQNDEFRNLFALTGWQVPALMIDGNRVLVAPPDDPALYCLDLLTGKLLWQKKELKRENALYVACIRNGIAYIVTPESMLALKMESGEPVWEFSLSPSQPTITIRQSPPFPSQSAKSSVTETVADKTKPHLRFPSSLKPNGIGVRNGSRYFLPFTDGYLGIIDLDQGTIEWMSPQLISQTSSTAPAELKNNPEPDSDFLAEPFFLRNGSFPSLPTGQETDDPVQDSLLYEELSLGNLIGLRGRFVSQTPTRLIGFDQLEPLKNEATARLEADPNDSEGLLQLGRVRRAEKKIAESIALFRRSLQSRYSEHAADCLRKTLLEAIRKDYSTWSSAGSELEALAEFPEELGEILFVLAQGALQNGKTDELTDLLQKVFYLEMDQSISVPVDAELSSQLHRILGKILEQSLQNSKNPELKNRINQVAESIFQQLIDKKIPDSVFPKLKWNRSNESVKNQLLLRPWWEQELMLLFSEIRSWQVFTGLFRSVPISDQAQAVLREHYERHQFFIALESAWNFPVEWFLPARFFDPPKPTPASDSSSDSAAVASLPSTSSLPPSPPVLQTSAFDFEKTKYLAALLESRDNIADAFYYYRILEKSFGEQGLEIYRTILKKPSFQKFYEQELTLANWSEGDVLIEDDPQKNAALEPSKEGAVARILRAAQPQNRYRSTAANQQYRLPFLGSYEPFLSPYSYALEIIQPDVFLVCYDRFGEERWRSQLSDIYPDMMDYGFFNENSSHYSYGFSDQTVYLKGCNHLLLFVRENEMIAFDTFRCDSEKGPKILWTKTLSTALPSRQTAGSVALGHFQVFASQSDRGFPKESLFVSPQIVCYRDSDRIHGLDPMTGQTLWTRKIPSASCSIFGDRENLFLVFSDIHQAIAVDPFVGQELASGRIPHGGILAFGTNLVFLKYVNPSPGSNPENGFQLYLSDLRELFQKRRRALIFTDDTESGTIPSIPTYPIAEGLSHEAMVRSFHYGRLLGLVSWTSKTIRVYDLQTRSDLLGPVGDWGRRTGAVLPELKYRGQARRHDCDFDVELFGDQFLVYFTESGEVNLRPSDEVEDGVVFKRRRSPVVNIHARPVGTGSIMLYDVDGKPCWAQAARIDDWYRLLRVPPNTPVVLFAVMFNEDIPGQPTISSTALLGIDKQNGVTRFRALIPPLQRPLLQGFRVTVDPNKKEISFLTPGTPGRTVNAKFTDQTKIPQPKTNSPKTNLPKTTSPLNRLPQEWFEMFRL
ncbi:MAG: PQQ-binding-like beta-propeller repeat protein [Planctomycetaceae bacterium]|jgi:outer membrane protein assembly factor BamB|nr:PQQ-binding-like beta-propeller repeat protein [Planctomycetaceae bacterium]